VIGWRLGPEVGLNGLVEGAAEGLFVTGFKVGDRVDGKLVIG
jgi:hypothetical protein